jgi:phage portal protein BeeE
MTLFDSLPPDQAARIGVLGEPPPKAATGPGVAMIQFGTPLSAFSRTPQKLMREAQALYHANPWIASAERTVTRRVAGLPWHLEDENDEEIEEGGTGPTSVVRQLLDRPQANLPNVGRKMTRRELWSVTSRHMGLCGMAYWYLDQPDASYKFPLGIMYVNPARVWTAEDAAGNLIGWVLDPKDDTGRGGVPLDVHELLPFYLDPPDFGHYATGLVEAAGLKAKITDYADRHAAFVLATGGRMAGIVAPKAGILTEDQFAKLVREFRNVAEAPDAAKRLTILEGPVDFTQTAASPSDLALTDLSKMNRDDIFAVWGVPPSIAGIPAPAGLNSGDSRKIDEATLMQGAVHDRVVSMQETIQYGLLDRLPFTVNLVIEEPTFDDDMPAYEVAAKARDLPLTNAERRELVGLGPFGKPEIDNAVWLPVGLTEAFTGGPDGPSPTPEPVAPPTPPPFTGEPEQSMPAKASPLAKLRSKLDKVNVPAIERAVAKVLEEQRDEIVEWVRGHAEHVLANPKDTRWWNAARWDKRLRDAIAPYYARTGEAVYSGVGATMPRKADPLAEGIVSTLLTRAGKRITGINETTRDEVLRVIREALAEGFEQGDPARILGEKVAAAAAFDEYRAERIARTEAMWSYNTAALESYRAHDVEYVEALDGDGDEACAARNGNIFTLAEAAIETEAEHPNGTLDWSPVVGYEVVEKGADVQEADVRRIVAEMVGKAGELPAATIVTPIHVHPQFAMTMPEQPAPVVVNQVTVPEQAAPQVTVNVPEQKAEAPVVNVTVPEQKAAMVQDIRIVSQPTVRNTVLRDRAGQMIGTIEEPIDG